MCRLHRRALTRQGDGLETAIKCMVLLRDSNHEGNVLMRLDHTIAQHLEKLPLTLQSEVLDYVLYLEQKAEKQTANDSERRNRLASALQKVASMNPYAEVDPDAWVQEQRAERSLPGRD